MKAMSPFALCKKRCVLVGIWALVWIGLAACGGLAGYECQEDQDCGNDKRCQKGWCQTAPPPPIARVTPPEKRPGGCLEGARRTCQSSPGAPLLTPCQAGEERCTQGVWSTCQGEIKPTTEQCDGLDNNCNGKVDEGLDCGCTNGDARPCYAGKSATQGVGPCKAGTQTCRNLVWGACIGEIRPQEESCNGIDDDCNGQIDQHCQTCIPNKLHATFGVRPTERSGLIIKNKTGTIIAQGWNGARSIQLFGAQKLLLGRTLQNGKHDTKETTWMGFHPTQQEHILVHSKNQRSFAVWNVVEGRYLRDIPFPSGLLGIQRIRIQPQGDVLALLDKQGTLHIFSFKAETWHHLPKEAPISTFTFHSREPHLFYVASTLRRWDVANKRLLGQMWAPGDPIEIWHVPSLDGLLMWYRGRTLQLRNVGSGKVMLSMPAQGLDQVHLDDVRENIHMLDIKGVLRTYNMQKETLSKGISTCAAPGGLLLLDTNKYVATACPNGRIALWHLASGQLEQQAPAPLGIHTGSIQALAIDVGGNKMLSASNDGTVLLWNPANPTQLPTALKHEAPVTTMALSPDAQTLVTGAGTKGLRIWDLKTGSARVPKDLQSSEILQVRFSPDGQHIASSNKKGDIVLWETKSGNKLHTWQTPPGGAAGLLFAADGKTLYAGAQDGHIHSWNTQTGTLQNRKFAHNSPILSLALGPMGQTLATMASSDFKLWSWPNPSLQHVERATQSQAWTSVDFRPHSQHVATSSANVVAIWSPKGTQLARWQAHYQTIEALQFQGDGKALLTAGKDQVIKLWRCP